MRVSFIWKENIGDTKMTFSDAYKYATDDISKLDFLEDLIGMATAEYDTTYRRFIENFGTLPVAAND